MIRGPGGSTWRRACCPPGRARQLLHLVQGLVPDRRRRCRCSPGAGRVILRQLPGLDPAAGLLVAVVALAALVALFFAFGPVPWSGSLRRFWPCCRLSLAWSCRLPPVRIAAGMGWWLPFAVRAVPVERAAGGGASADQLFPASVR